MLGAAERQADVADAGLPNRVDGQHAQRRGRERGALRRTALAAVGEGWLKPLSCAGTSSLAPLARAPRRGLACLPPVRQAQRSILVGPDPIATRCEALEQRDRRAADSAGGAGAPGPRSSIRASIHAAASTTCAIALSGRSSASPTRCSCSRASLERLVDALLVRARSSGAARSGWSAFELEDWKAQHERAGPRAPARARSRSSARELRRRVRASDELGRLGEAQIAVILPGCEAGCARRASRSACAWRSRRASSARAARPCAPRSRSRWCRAYPRAGGADDAARAARRSSAHGARARRAEPPRAEPR